MCVHLCSSTPCPNVKHGEEWGEPANCEAGDNCQYCHTRTEQQFHPEIYKSTKCNDVQQAGYCPRSVFCAFAHVERKYNMCCYLKLNIYFVESHFSKPKFFLDYSKLNRHSSLTILFVLI